MRIIIASDQGQTPEEKTAMFGLILETIIEDMDFDIKARHRFEDDGGYVPPPQPLLYVRTLQHHLSPREWRRLYEGTFLPVEDSPPKEPK